MAIIYILISLSNDKTIDKNNIFNIKYKIKNLGKIFIYILFFF